MSSTISNRAIVCSMILVITCVLAVLVLPSKVWRTPDQQAQHRFEDGDYAGAAQEFSDPVRAGIAWYRAGEFEQAAANFARVDDAVAAYNRGNALVMLGKYDDAIASYDRALQFRPAWNLAVDNRAVAVARRDRLAPPDDDAGGTGGQLEADELVFDDRAQKSQQTQQIEVGKGDAMSDSELRALWLRRVQTEPADFLRAKFSYQLSKREAEASE